MRIRGWFRFLADNPEVRHDFERGLVYPGLSSAWIAAEMPADQSPVLTEAHHRPRHSTSGRWDSDKLVETFSKSAAPKAGHADLTKFAEILRKLVVCQRVVRRFTEEMGWPAAEQHSFDTLNPNLLQNAESWLICAEDLIRHAASRSGQTADLLVAAAYDMACRGASLADLETAAPEDSFRSEARNAFIRGEAALRNGMTRRAALYFARAALLAPHIGAPHRRLGQMALAENKPWRAAHHFESATAIPNHLWITADQPDDIPLLVCRIDSRFYVYRCHGKLYAVPWSPDTRGVTVVADRLIQVFDTPAFRMWMRVKADPAYKALLVLLARLDGSGLGRRLKRLALLFVGSGGGNMRAARDSPVSLFRAARRHASLAILRIVFRAREVPSELQCETLAELMERIGRAGTRT